MTGQPTLQDCVDELEQLKEDYSKHLGPLVDQKLEHMWLPLRIVKIQRMIVSVSEAVLNRSSENLAVLNRSCKT